MNKFLSKFVATALLSAVTITAANAANEAVWSGISDSASGFNTGADSTVDGGDLLGGDVNLTITLNADMNPGTTFDFHVVDGSIANSGAYLLCNETEPVGKYVNLVASNAAGRATTIGLEFSTDANTSLTKDGQTLHLIDSSNDQNCSATNSLNMVPDLGKCISVFSDNGLNNNGSRVVGEINSATVHVLDYKADIMIACDTPICGIATNGTEFTTTAASSGINKRLATNVSYDSNATSTTCYKEGCEDEVGKSYCTTFISIQNNTDQNITSVKLDIDGVIPAGMYVTVMNLDGNNSEDNVTLNGSSLQIDNLTIYADGTEDNATLELRFFPNGTDTIVETMLTGTLTLDTNDTNSLLNGAVLETNGIAKFSAGGTTDFTVTYMNPSFKSFAMITAIGDDTKLSATITDSTGATASATFPDVPKGETVFVWADKAGHATHPLQVAADAAGLNGAWRVDFHVTAAVDVAAYMEANGGQRTLTVLYPEYTNDLTNP